MKRFAKKLCIVLGTAVCFASPLQVKGNHIRGFWGGRGVGNKESFSVHTTNSTSQRQYFVAHCFSPSALGSHTFCACFPSTRKPVTYEKLTVFPSYCTCTLLFLWYWVRCLLFTKYEQSQRTNSNIISYTVHLNSPEQTYIRYRLEFYGSEHRLQTFHFTWKTSNK